MQNLTAPSPNGSLSNNSVPVWESKQSLLNSWFGLALTFSLFGGVVNTLLFAAVVSEKKLRLGSGILIAHSIFVDGLMCMVAFPLWNATYVLPQYGYLPSTNALPNIHVYFLRHGWADCWGLVTIALYRLIAIFVPHYYTKATSTHRLLSGLLFSWLLASTCTVTYLFEKIADIKAVKPWFGCSTVPVNLPVFGFITQLNTVVPEVIQGAMYFSVFVLAGFRMCVKKLRVDVAVEQGPRTLVMNKRLKTTRMMFASYVWLPVLFAPAAIASAVAPGVYVARPEVPLFFRFLILCGCATNPVVYLAMNAEYRGGVKRIVASLVCGKSTATSASVELPTRLPTVTTHREIK